MTTIPITSAYRIIRLMVKLERPEICRHYVACCILSELERCGVDVPIELIDAITDNSLGDDRAINILDDLLK